MSYKECNEENKKKMKHCVNMILVKRVSNGARLSVRGTETLVLKYLVLV